MTAIFYPVVISKVANGFLVSPVPLDDELPPDPAELHVFPDLEKLFEYLSQAENEQDAPAPLPEPESTPEQEYTS